MTATQCLCTLTTGDGVKINNRGVCNLCSDLEQEIKEGIWHKSFMPNESKSRNDLKSKLEEVKNRKNRSNYDCLLHLSGGKDSVMALYELINIYDMRVLAFMHDNGFESDAAKNNAKNASDILGVDLVYFKHENAFKPFYHFFRSDLYKKIDVCTFCEHFQEPFHAFAQQLMNIYDIPIEITGSATDANIPQPLLCNDHELISEFLEANENIFRLKNNELLCKYVNETNKRVRINYWAEVPQNMESTIKTVKEFLNWKPKHSDSTDTGCDLCYIQMLIDNKIPPRRSVYKYIKAYDIRMRHVTPEFYNKDRAKLAEQEEDEICIKTKEMLKIFNLNLDDL
jgi:hypothetical protein